jgi:hypothetical protein
MKQVIGGAVALLVLMQAQPAAAQQAPATGQAARSMEQAIEASGIVPALESLVTSATPELERALDQLAVTLSGIASRLASDPELRSSTVRAARGVADVAEAAVVEQSSVIQEALRAMADRIEAIAAGRERRN